MELKAGPQPCMSVLKTLALENAQHLNSHLSTTHWRPGRPKQSRSRQGFKYPAAGFTKPVRRRGACSIPLVQALCLTFSARPPPFPFLKHFLLLPDAEHSVFYNFPLSAAFHMYRGQFQLTVCPAETNKPEPQLNHSLKISHKFSEVVMLEMLA